jgi:hypothetical protein
LDQPKIDSRFVALGLELLSKKQNIKLPEEQLTKISKKVKNYKLNEICQIYRAMSLMCAPGSEVLGRTQARAMRDSNIERASLD